MKKTKIAALIGAAAILTAGAAFTSMAATTGWQQENGTWVYYDKYGDYLTEGWAKSGSYWYWLDEDGHLATDQIIEDDGNYYYVNEDGVMVSNQWVLADNTDDAEGFEDQIWYYFQPSGKAYKASEGNAYSWKTVNGKKYAFDEEGRMLFGWLNREGMMDKESADSNYEEGIFYCGDNMDGARRTNAWEKMNVDADGEDKDWWFYFGSNGEKVSGTTKKINGVSYAFDDDGHMASEWVDTSGSTDSSASAAIGDYRYFSSPESGAKYTKGWFQVVPAEHVNNPDYEDDTAHWFYAKGIGELYASTLKTINNKTYGFNEKGEMVSGLYWSGREDDGSWFFTKVEDGGALDFDAVTEVGTSMIPNAENREGLRYFGDEQTDGSMKTGSVTIDYDGESHKMKFQTSGSLKGCGVNGKDGSYCYVNGVKIEADADQKYQLFEIDENKNIVGKGINASQYQEGTSYYCLSSTGSIIKSGTKTDADDYKITVGKNGIVSGVTRKD